MFFGMMEAQRGYNTGQTEDYLKYKWIGLEVKGFQLVLDFGFGFLFRNERPGEPSTVRFEPGWIGFAERRNSPLIWKIIAFRSREAEVYEFEEDEKEEAARGVSNYLMHGRQTGFAFNRAIAMLAGVLRCKPGESDDVCELLLKHISTSTGSEPVLESAITGVKLPTERTRPHGRHASDHNLSAVRLSCHQRHRNFSDCTDES